MRRYGSLIDINPFGWKEEEKSDRTLAVEVKFKRIKSGLFESDTLS